MLVGGDKDSAVLPHAGLAVDFFFVLSGFVIGYAYDAQLSTGRMNFFSFFRARIIRVYPLVALGVSISGGLLIARVSSQDGFLAIFLAAVITVAGLLLIPLPSSYFAPYGYGGNPYINSPEWSLFFELGINFLYGGVAKRLTSRALLLCAGIGLASVAWFLFFSGAIHSDWIVFVGGFPRVLFSFSVGLLLFRSRMRSNFVQSNFLAVALCLILMGALFSPSLFSPWDSIFLIAIVFPAIVFFGSNFKVSKALTRAFDLSGRISYPLYILHFPLLRFFSHFAIHGGFSANTRLAFLLVEVPLIVLISFLALVFFDEPVRAAWKVKWKARFKPAGSLQSE